LGDIIHALPCAAALKDFHPETKIVWLVDQRWQAVLSDNPVIDEIVLFPRERFRGIAGMLTSIPWSLHLRKIRPDIALDLQGLFRSALMARLSRAGRVIGISDAREGATRLYHEVVPVIRGEHAVLRYLRILESLGLPKVERPVFPLPPGDPLDAPFRDQPFVVLHPFARGEGKSLAPEQVFQFCERVRPLTTVLAGVGKLQRQLPGNTINLLNRTTVKEMIWLLRAADFVVSVDSGPMHIAAAVGAKMLSIHTWSDPRLVGPFSDEAWIWQGGQIRRQEVGAPSLLPARLPQDEDILEIADFVGRFVAEQQSAR
jgi:heptosyltransferase I